MQTLVVLRPKCAAFGLRANLRHQTKMLPSYCARQRPKGEERLEMEVSSHISGRRCPVTAKAQVSIVISAALKPGELPRDSTHTAALKSLQTSVV